MHGRTTAFLLMLAAMRLTPTVHAQEVARPQLSNATWISAQVRGNVPFGIGKALGKHYEAIRLSGDVGYRTADNFFAGRQIYGEGGIRYKLNKTFALAGEYRYADRGPNRTNRQRLQVTGQAGWKFGRTSVDYRLIHQWTYRKYDTTRRFIRNRIGVEYNIPKWKFDPAFSMEFFTRTDHPLGWNYEGVRYRLETAYKFSKVHPVEAGLIYDRDAMVAWPTRRVILSIGYTMDLRWI